MWGIFSGGSKKPRWVLDTEKEAVTSLCYRTDERIERIFAAARGRRITLFETDQGASTHSVELEEAVLGMQFHPAEKCFVVYTATTIRFLHRFTLKTLWRFNKKDKRIQEVLLLRDGKLLCIDDSHAQVRSKEQLEGQPFECGCPAVSAQNLVAYIVQNPYVIRGRSITNGEKPRLLEFKGHEERITALACDEQGLLVSGDARGSIRRWDLGTQSSLGYQGECGQGISTLVFSSGGETLFSGSFDGSAAVWSHGRTPQWLDGHAASILCASFSPDGQELVTGSRDGAIKVWSL